MGSSQPLSYFKPGDKLGKYEIKSLLGRGGMAEVYRALNPDLGQDVAIKILQPTDEPGGLERFRQEARAIATLSHPNIIRVFDFDSRDSSNYMVMELIEGPTLADLMRKEQMSLERINEFFGQLCAAVDYAHEQGVIHRDIKPANALIATNNRLVLTDFGLARLQGGQSLSATGGAAGTPAYMSPEQAMGDKVTPKSDIYALGVILFEMVTGKIPFEAVSLAAVLVKHIQEPPPVPSQVSVRATSQMDYVILRALAKKPEERFETANELAEAFAQAISDELDTVNISSDALKTFAAPAAVPTQAANTLVNPADSRPTQATVVINLPQGRSLGVLITTVIALLLLGAAAVTYLMMQPDENQQGSGNVEIVEATPLAPSGMIYIPAGRFQMGAANGNENEKPLHDVRLEAFFMDQNEVTNRDYREFVEETGYRVPLGWEVSSDSPAIWKVNATEGYVAGDLFDRFSYDGKKVSSLEGATISIDLDADAKIGQVIFEYSGELKTEISRTLSGDIRIVHDVFFGTASFQEAGVSEDVHMHGDSGQEASFIPTVIGYVASWGTSDVYVDGELVYQKLGTHMMYMNGVRDDQRRVLRANGECCYNPTTPSDGLTDNNDEEVTLYLVQGPGSAYSNPESESLNGSLPIWIDIYFEDVTVQEQPEDSGLTQALSLRELNLPVTGVTWDDAVAYCSWRIKRLPTEAEWEYAARGGSSFAFPWGNEASPPNGIPANVASGQLVPVGSNPTGASPFGLQDMAGNAWEWVADWYSPTYYAESPRENPLGPTSGELRLLRGGGPFQLDVFGPSEYRAAYRLAVLPTIQDPTFGFRCAQDVE